MKKSKFGVWSLELAFGSEAFEAVSPQAESAAQVFDSEAQTRGARRGVRIFVLFLLTTFYLSLFTPIFAQDKLGPGAAGLPQFQQMIQRLINVAVGLAFVILIFVLVWAGIKFLTSGGDSKAIQNAYDIITWGVLGLMFMAIAWLILLLIQTFTGVPVTNFCLGFNCE